MVCGLAAAACSLRPPPPTPSPQPLAATATQAPTNSAPPVPDATATEAPTHTAEPSPTASATPGAVTGTPSTDLAPTTDAAAVNKAEFVADVTVPDGANFTPGETFVKTWRIKNTGTSTWGTGYLLVYAKGERMGGPETLALPSSVAPGQTVDLSLNLTAPDKLGSFTGFWQFRSDVGQPFGIGAEANQPIYVQINVGAAASGSPAPTVPAGTLQVTGVTMSVDQSSVTGVCPQAFVFSAALTSQGAGNTTYRIEAVADTPGFVFNLPAANESLFTGAGPRTFNASYTLEFSGSVSGQVWVHVLTPNDLQSNKVSFSLTCQAGE